jgi:transmembrane sensor
MASSSKVVHLSAVRATASRAVDEDPAALACALRAGEAWAERAFREQQTGHVERILTRILGGPFEIHVTGTSFEAGWDPVREELSVTMHRGRVVVRAPCLAAERALADGDVAVISCASPPFATSDATHPRAAATSDPSRSSGPGLLAPPERPEEGAPHPRRGAALAAPLAVAGSATVAVASPPAPAATALSWRDLARASRYPQALAAAEAEGFGALCDTLPAADLMELGATARLAGHSARAVEAYGAVRRRFGGGDTAATAAFHLGQLAFDGAHALDDAHRWFSTYLAERPGGALAPEALGRAMEAEQRLGDLATARTSAASYLARYPDGAHAALARSLLAP